jgi:hypothetical protein
MDDFWERDSSGKIDIVKSLGIHAVNLAYAIANLVLYSLGVIGWIVYYIGSYGWKFTMWTGKTIYKIMQDNEKSRKREDRAAKRVVKDDETF